ncbi:hypothetical protein CsSME_00007373 [Camellia sinensis var. sinensis]
MQQQRWKDLWDVFDSKFVVQLGVLWTIRRGDWRYSLPIWSEDGPVVETYSLLEQRDCLESQISQR